MAENSNQSASASGGKPLAQKTDAELQRETKARLKRLDPLTATEIVNEVVSKQVSGSVGGFVMFLRQNGITGLAIGFVVGTQVQGVVKQLIASFIDPLAQLFGGKSLSDRTFTWHVNGQDVKFGWGGFVFAIINFLLILAIIYVIIKLFKLDKLDKPKV